MHYCSTRGESEYVPAAEAIIKGLAPDGGLYVPADRAAPFSVDNLPTGSYRETAANIFKLFLTDYDSTEINEAVNSAYSPENFDHPSVTPVKRLSEDLFVLELWHGPTYAFKDIALQILPFLMRTAAQKCGENAEIVILTATSGDTGKSALEGFRDVPGTRIVVYFPEKGVSEIQKLQMITQEGNNVFVAAVNGNFDHTQSGVKEIFNDRKLAEKLARSGYRLSSANSINWGRLLPQLVYYFTAYHSLVEHKVLKPGEKINFIVPTGNFGNILAGFYACKMGLPINRLICAANRNNVLSDFINSGHYNSRRKLYPTLSPSMDILVSSNLERLLFELTEHDSKRIRAWMEQLKTGGEYLIDADTLNKLQGLFWSDYADDKETLQTIADTYRGFDSLIDTHTAVGKAVLDRYRAREKDCRPSVILSTASPFKFTGSVVRALFKRNHFENVSELEMMKILARETGTAIPANLAALDQKPIRHQKVITPGEMRDHLQNILA